MIGRGWGLGGIRRRDMIWSDRDYGPLWKRWGDGWKVDSWKRTHTPKQQTSSPTKPASPEKRYDDMISVVIRCRDLSI